MANVFISAQMQKHNHCILVNSTMMHAGSAPTHADPPAVKINQHRPELRPPQQVRGLWLHPGASHKEWSPPHMVLSPLSELVSVRT